jgi:hypothetical protein
MAFAPSVLRPEARGVAPRGVDLALDNFDLSEATRTEEKAGATWSETDAALALGKAFFANVDGESSVFKAEDKKLLQAIFTPKMSDRREEGSKFVPPDPSANYLDSLRTILKAEDAARTRRKDAFYSAEFSVDEPGHEFPGSWTSLVRISGAGSASRGALQRRPDYTAASPVVENILRAGERAFEKFTEDGMAFRIYRSGSLEVRTTQEHGAEEIVGAVFSISKTVPTIKQGVTKESEHIVKVTEYVTAGAQYRRSYVVLETDKSTSIVTEQLSNGAHSWEENPADLEDRIAVAKVIRSAECKDLIVADLKLWVHNEIKEATAAKKGASQSLCKAYAQRIYVRAADIHDKSVKTGFVLPPRAAQSALSNVPVKGGVSVTAAVAEEKVAAQRGGAARQDYRAHFAKTSGKGGGKGGSVQRPQGMSYPALFKHRC